jgi:hypothetical protein
MASVRVRQRKDGSSYTAVLYVLNGKQTSSSFNDHAEALRFQELANRISPAKALEVWATRALDTAGFSGVVEPVLTLSTMAPRRSVVGGHEKLPTGGHGSAY